ncbi:hypothetical protein HN020_12735 [Brevibacillus borstelensis]|uniref:hypothetical protein n=1 Tax=Brevibacillus borstelensis TaxID=45462 RepID=UPI00148FE0D1|nr:hypothetical protein [Brevibacillus borstelensis]NOU55608.1 hypothetical protein [Brevibacillus borstelensis]
MEIEFFLLASIGPDDYIEEYAYERLFDFITFVLLGRKTANGWEYYRLQLKPEMVPMQYRDVLFINGRAYQEGSDPWPFDDRTYTIRKKVTEFAVPRFDQMLAQARADALKPRAWDWSRDLIHHPKFTKQVAAYRKNKTSKNLNAVYQAVRKHYNLNRKQDSVEVIKSVLNHVK